MWSRLKSGACKILPLQFQTYDRMGGQLAERTRRGEEGTLACSSVQTNILLRNDMQERLACR
jgi:hypothetical protein